MKKLLFGLLVAILLNLACNNFKKPEVRVLVKGALISGTNGIIFDSRDQLYIASVNEQAIFVMDPESGEILERIGNEKGVQGPDDLAFGPDGSLYWTDILVGNVVRLTPNGEYSSQFVARGVNPITFSDDGRLFVALDFFGDALYEIDPDLEKPPRLIIENLGWLNGMDWGPDGLLYGPLWQKGQVIRIDVDSGIIDTVCNSLHTPSAVKFDSKGHLHVLDFYAGEVFLLIIETGEKKRIAKLTQKIDNLAFDANDHLYISNHREGYIIEVLTDGTIRTVSPGGMTGPAGVAIIPHSNGESVFVTDRSGLFEFNGITGELRHVERFKDWLNPDGTLKRSSTVLVNKEDSTLVLSSWDNVQVWNFQTRRIVKEYTNYKALNAIMFRDDIIIADDSTKSLIRASDGFVLTNIIHYPLGLATTNDDLWVGDWEAGEVLQVIDNGELLPEPIIIAKNLSSPEGLALLSNNSLLVVESGIGSLSSINLETGEVNVIADGLKLDISDTLDQDVPSMKLFNGVAVGPSGFIYVTGDGANVLYKIDPN